MSLGPTTLSEVDVLKIINHADNQKLVANYLSNIKIKWKDNSLLSLKNEIRLSLRKQQEGRCIFCKRKILTDRRNACEDIEHYLDKSKNHYRKWAFSSLNLSIACHPCNMEKGTTDLAINSSAASINYPTGAGAFKWLHPYSDDYFANIDIGKGWTYTVKSNAPFPLKAQAMIDDCKLADIERIEAHAEEIKKTIERLTKMSGKALKRGKINLAQKLIDMSYNYQQEHWHDL